MINNFFRKFILKFFFIVVLLFLFSIIFSSKVKAADPYWCSYWDWGVTRCTSWAFGGCGSNGCSWCNYGEKRLCWRCYSGVSYGSWWETRCNWRSSCDSCSRYGSWYDVGCGSAGCSSTKMAQRRNKYWWCKSGICSYEYRCVSSSSCRTCNCGGWSNIGCGNISCPSNQMAQRQYCYWSDGDGVCDTNYRCINDSSCTVCTCSGWSNVGCGSGSCASYQMRQTRSCTPSGCNTTSRCVDSSSCGSNCGQACASNGCNACACNNDSRSGSYSWSTIGPTWDCHSPNCYCGRSVATPTPRPTSTPIPTNTPTPTPTPPPTCTVSLSPNSLSLTIGKSDLLTADVAVQNGNVNRVDFSSSDAGVASVDPASDGSSPYRTQVTGESIGSAQVNASVSLNPSGSCSVVTPSNISVEAAGWFQTEGGTIHAEGNLSNEIPSTATNRNLSIAVSGFPGVISHQSTTEANLGEGYPSNDDANHWLAKSSYQGKGFSSWTFFEKKYAVEMETEDFTGTLPNKDGIYYSGSGKALQGNWNVPANRWLLILVDGDVSVPSNISVSNGSFLGLVSSGDISFEDTTSQVEGMFIAGSTINTSVSSTQFQGEGFFAASQFVLERDLGGSNPTTPAELFTFRPDFLINSYKDADHNLWWFDFKWEEIAP